METEWSLSSDSIRKAHSNEHRYNFYENSLIFLPFVLHNHIIWVMWNIIKAIETICYHVDNLDVVPIVYFSTLKIGNLKRNGQNDVQYILCRHEPTDGSSLQS